jgi:hypothetical protein
MKFERLQDALRLVCLFGCVSMSVASVSDTAKTSRKLGPLGFMVLLTVGYGIMNACYCYRSAHT